MIEQTLDIPDPDGDFPYFLIGDAAFPLSKYLLKPFGGKLYDDLMKTIFNYRLSRARRTIENTFGILAAKWRIFRGPLMTGLKTAHLIIKASVCLHNFVLIEEVKKYCPRSFVDRESDGKWFNGDWRKIVKDDKCFTAMKSLGSNFSSQTARDLRDSVAQIFLTKTGSVPWQMKSVANQMVF